MKKHVYSMALITLFTGALFMQQSALAQEGEVEALRTKVKHLQDKVKRLESRIDQIEKLLQSSNDRNRGSKNRINQDGWQSQENWRRLQKGMSKSEVRHLLGKPGKIRSRSYGDTWYYPDVLGGSVSFDNSRVDGWSEP